MLNLQKEFLIRLTHFNPVLDFIYKPSRFHIETSPMVCSANQWTGFYMITARFLYEIKQLAKIG